MKYNQLGKSDIKVSALSLGTMQFGAAIDKATAFQMMDLCFDKGITTIDTAEMYAVPSNKDIQGTPELWIGEWLKTKDRDAVQIATKVAGPNGMIWIPTRRVPATDAGPTPMDKTTIPAAVDGSLQRLGVEVIDLYQLHWPSRYRGGAFGNSRYKRENEEKDVTSYLEQVEALDALVKAGKIKAWGVSNENTWGLSQFEAARAKLDAAPCVSIQNDFSLINRTFEPEVAEACSPHNLDIGLLVYGALAGGTLSGKYADPKAQGRHASIPKFQPRYHSDLSRQAAASYKALAEERGMTATELATAFVLNQEYVSSLIMGMTRLEQLDEMLKGEGRVLDAETLFEIDRIHFENPNPTFRYHGVYDVEKPKKGERGAKAEKLIDAR